MSDKYLHGGARALVQLHATHLRAFLPVWKRAQAAGLALPKTEDPNYASLEALLVHVLRAARGYMTWICAQLDLPDPDIRSTPDASEIEGEADEYLEHVLERWREPLREVVPDAFEHPEFESRWGTLYCIDAMLEHAVMHPIRHSHQLEQLLSAH